MCVLLLYVLLEMPTPLDYVPGLAYILFASVIGWGVTLEGTPVSVAATIARRNQEEGVYCAHPRNPTAGLTKSKHSPLLLPRFIGILLHQHNRGECYCLQHHHGGPVHHLRRRGRGRFAEV